VLAHPVGRKRQHHRGGHGQHTQPAQHSENPRQTVHDRSFSDVINQTLLSCSEKTWQIRVKGV
jgi:hypothetical protein